MIVSTPSATNSNSYASLEEADAYMLTRIGSSKWNDLEDEHKEAYLITATNDLETIIWQGLKEISDQRLSWPRIGIYNWEGVLLEGIPELIKMAQFETVMWRLTEEDRMMSDVDVMQISKMSVGPLSIEMLSNPITLPPVVDLLIKKLGPSVVLQDRTSKNNIQFVI